MVPDEMLSSYPDPKLPLTVCTDASDKQLGSFIIQNNNHIASFSIRLSNPMCNYTTTKKEILTIVECLKNFQGFILVYEINVFSYNRNLVYAKTLSESQRLMLWQLIINEFGPNSQNIYGVNNIVADTVSRLPSTPSDKYKPCTRNYQCHVKKLFAIGRIENNKYCFPLIILIVKKTKTDKYKFLTQYINFGSRIRLLH